MYSAVDEKMADLTRADICAPDYYTPVPSPFDWRKELRNDDLVVAGKAIGRMVMRGIGAAKNKLQAFMHRKETPRYVPQHAAARALETTITFEEAMRRARTPAAPDWDGGREFARTNPPAWHATRVQELPIVHLWVGSGVTARHAAPPVVRLEYVGDMLADLQKV